MFSGLSEVRTCAHLERIPRSGASSSIRNHKVRGTLEMLGRESRSPWVVPSETPKVIGGNSYWLGHLRVHGDMCNEANSWQRQRPLGCNYDDLESIEVTFKVSESIMLEIGQGIFGTKESAVPWVFNKVTLKIDILYSLTRVTYRPPIASTWEPYYHRLIRLSRYLDDWSRWQG